MFYPTNNTSLRTVCNRQVRWRWYHRECDNNKGKVWRGGRRRGDQSVGSCDQKWGPLAVDIFRKLYFQQIHYVNRSRRESGVKSVTIR